jgi:hypothetical protein
MEFDSMEQLNLFGDQKANNLIDNKLDKEKAS